MMQFTVDTFVQVSLDTVGAIKAQVRCACGQKHMNGPAHSVHESRAVVGLADQPLDQSRASGHLQESIRNIKLHRVLDGCFEIVSIIRAGCKISIQRGESSDVSCYKTRLC